MQVLKSEDKGLRDLLLGCLFICLLSLIMGLGSNFLRASPLPLIPPFLFASYEEIDPVQAHRLAAEGKVLFLDSRENSQYKKTHLPRALSLPVKTFSTLYPSLGPLIPANGWIIIYGEGRLRPTERELAFLFLQAGEKRIKILSGGIPAWVAKGYPVKRR